MSLDADQIYALLPAIHRTRDAAAGGPLQALIGVIAEQVGVLEQDLRNLLRRPVHRDLRALGGAVYRRPDRLDRTVRGRAERRPRARRGRQHDGLPAPQGDGDRARAGRARRHRAAGPRRRVFPPPRGEPKFLAISARIMRASSICAAAPRSTRIGGPFDTLNRTVDVRRIPPRNRTPDTPDHAAFDIALHGEGRSQHSRYRRLGVALDRLSGHRPGGDGGGCAALPGEPARRRHAAVQRGRRRARRSRV